MDTLPLIIAGAFLGVRFRRRLKRSPFNKVDHALTGGLATLLLVTLLDIAGLSFSDAPYYVMPGAVMLIVRDVILSIPQPSDSSHQKKYNDDKIKFEKASTIVTGTIH